MTILVTGATGHLGGLTVEALLARGVPADQITAGGRGVERLAGLAERGVRTVHLDYSDGASIGAAVEGADKVLIVSGNEFGQRVAQHVAVATAAAKAGAGLVAYTSAPYADTTTLQLAAEHRATEAAIAEIDVPHTFLRNSWYFENYTAQIPAYLAQGAVVGAAGDGRISGAARSEYAEAAAAVLAGDGHEGKVYELGGDDAFTLADLAASISRHSGKQIGYRNVSVAELTGILEGAGLPAPIAGIMADTDRGITEGALLVTSGDLSRLIGHPTSSLDDAVAAALAE